ncbi:HD domain-containing protein [Leisingera methylohalidivorans]|uniref:Phosphohydrolase n=1 Tax=Leisingera methylohalidivorans DSM 14336 TaxID=999552 RepID=V9VRM8_9RHOB|nr:HD domain-containing protein [Leisingera methylohalidivorans]AHC99984.1 phosphohydrolase [Leisingera methylohalidivorans DSM 14336]
MLDKSHKPTWTSFQNATAEDWAAVEAYEAAYNAALPERILDAIRSLDEDWTPYPVNRYQHSLQAATRAYEDGADDEIIVAALIHDTGDILSPYNHGELSAAMLKPYVSEKTYWILKHHCVFQGFYYNHHFGGDPNARDKYRGSPHWEDCRYFCEKYDQCAFDPEYPTKPLEFFEPILRRVLSRGRGHLELAETAKD